MNIREAPRIENGQEDQAKATNDSESNSEAGQDFLCDVVVHDQAALVSEVTLHAESGVEEYNHDCRASDEQWLAPCSRSKCRNVHDVLTWVIPRVAGVALCRPYTQHGNESAYISLTSTSPLNHVDNVSVPSHTHPATNGTNQYAKPNILAARVIYKSGEDAQSGLALFVYAPVETSKARVCRWMLMFREMPTRQRNSVGKSSNGWIIHDERVGDAKIRDVSAGGSSNKSRPQGPR